MIYNGKHVSGTGEALDGAVDKEIIAAPGANKRLYIQHIAITTTLGGADSGGEIALEDGVGGTRFIEIAADAGDVTSPGVFRFYFGEPGYPLSLNTALNLTVDGDGTTEATARATVTGMVV